MPKFRNDLHHFKRQIVRALFVLVIVVVSVFTGTATPARAALITLTSCATSELTAAINAANASSADDTIIISTPCQYLRPPHYEIESRGSAGKLTIVGNYSTFLEFAETFASPLTPYFTVKPYGDLTLVKLSLSHGASTYGGAIDVRSNGTLNVQESFFTYNQASISGGAIYVGTRATLTVTDTEFESNWARNQTGAGGGAVFSDGNATFERCRFLLNWASGSGGAILAMNPVGALNLYNTSFVYNRAEISGGAVEIIEAAATLQNVSIVYNGASPNGYTDPPRLATGGGLHHTRGENRPIRLQNSVIAQNSASDNLTSNDTNGTFSSLPQDSSHNFIGDGTGSTGLVNGQNSNRVGTLDSRLDPKVQTRDMYPFPVRQVPVPNADSPLINAGTNLYPIGTRDARGAARTRYGTVDIGAVEYKHKDHVAVFNPENAAWMFKRDRRNGLPDFSFVYGQGYPDVWPLTGDWDGDGYDTQGVFIRFATPAIAVFALSNTYNSFDAATLPAFPYVDNSSSWIPVKGDWNGDGVDSIGVYNTVTGLWALDNDNASTAPEYQFFFGGGAGVYPITGDWDGDGIDTIGTYDFSTDSRTVRQLNSNTDTSIVEQFDFNGMFDTMPVVLDWEGVGRDVIVQYRPTTGEWGIPPSDNGLLLVFGIYSPLRGLAGAWTPAQGGAVDPSIAPTFAP